MTLDFGDGFLIKAIPENDAGKDDQRLEDIKRDLFSLKDQI